ncbi:hypothetical protein BaRGS_00008115, partial [Batillaria attramentaria]
LDSETDFYLTGRLEKWTRGLTGRVATWSRVVESKVAKNHTISRIGGTADDNRPIVSLARVDASASSSIVREAREFSPGRWAGRAMMVKVECWWHKVEDPLFTKSHNMAAGEVEKRRWSCLGHALRMNKTRHPHAALRWAPPGRRKRGRPMGTTREKEEGEADGHHPGEGRGGGRWAPPGRRKRGRPMGTTREKEEGEADGHHPGEGRGGGRWAPPKEEGEADGHHPRKRGRPMGTTREKEEGEADGHHPGEGRGGGRWAPPGRRKRGRPMGTWRRTAEEEMKTAGKTGNELSWLAQDRDVWRRFVGA